jgi:dUTPase
LAIRYQIDVLVGVIDADYRGNVHVILIKHSATPLHIHAGVRVANLSVKRLFILIFVKYKKLMQPNAELGDLGQLDVTKCNINLYVYCDFNKM